MNSPFFICLLGLAIVFALFWVIRLLLAPKRSFSDFFVGDTGKYSLSRLQAVIWAFVIISYQVSALIAAMHQEQLGWFSLVFSKEVMWLLGLSLGSYVVVKGITVNQINNGGLPGRFNVQKNWSDLVTSDEGLDFSRFQMLIWTIFSVLVFVSSYYNYIDKILGSTNIKPLFLPYSDPHQVLPTIDMSLIVLMGLSQGAYIGRKLVPDNQVKDFTQDMLKDIETKEYGLSFQESELRIMLANPSVPQDKKVDIQIKLNDILSRKTDLANQKAAASKSLS